MKKVIKKIIIIILAVVFIWSAYSVFQRQNEKSTVVKELAEIKKSVVKEENNNKVIDWVKLKEINKDITAWIWIENTTVDYPIVTTDDNLYYLTHNYEKEYSPFGAIFFDKNNSGLFDDQNNIIYGHNSSYYSLMFADIEEIYKNPSGDYKIHIYTEDKEYEVETISIYEAPGNDYAYTQTFANDDKYDEYLKYITSKSIYNYNVDTNVDDTIITIYTCDLITGKNWRGESGSRIYLHAKIK